MTATATKTKKAKLSFQGIKISYQMYVWIEKARAIKKTAQEIAAGIYEQGKKDHMSNADMLAIINGVFSEYTSRHLRRITPPELKNVKMVRDQRKKETKEIADTRESDMSANDDQSEQEPQPESDDRKPQAGYEINTDLEYITMVNDNKLEDFMKGFTNNVFRVTEYNDLKKLGFVQISLVLPVTIKVRPNDQTATVQVDKELLNSLIQQKPKKRSKTKDDAIQS